MALNRLAIDLGTANTIVIVQGKGVVIQEPTVVAVSPSEKRLLAVGNEAREMLGKVPEGIEARRPMKMGTIANYRMTEALLKKFISSALGQLRFFKPEVIISVPASITSVEERAVIQALNSAGAGKIYLLPEPIAAALGAELPIHNSTANMIVNMGGGTSEIAVLSMNGIVSSHSERVAGDSLNDAIQEYVKKKRGLLIGEKAAESIKINIGSAIKLSDPMEMQVNGLNLKSGLPDSITISSDEIAEIVKPILNKILRSIHSTLSKIPPELASDIIDKGIVLSGGTAMLRNVDVFFTDALGVPVHVVEEPLYCVVRGLEHALERIEDFKRSIK